MPTVVTLELNADKYHSDLAKAVAESRAAAEQLAARESGATFQYAMHEMSLSAVCALFVNYRRREDKDTHLTRRPKPEILELIDRRVDELAEVFLIEGRKDHERTQQTTR